MFSNGSPMCFLPLKVVIRHSGNIFGSFPAGLDPGLSFPIIAEINRLGPWSIFGITFKGFMLSVVWLIEILVILGIPAYLLSKTSPKPFSERMRKWYPCFTIQEEFTSVSNPERIAEELAEDPVQALTQMKGASSMYHAKAHLYYIEGEQDQYLSMENFRIQRGKETSWKSEVAIKALRISPQDARRMKVIFQMKPNYRMRF